MSFPVIPINASGSSSQPIRGLTWSVNRSPKYSTIVQQTYNGRELRLPRWTNSLSEWELTWEVIFDGWASKANQASNIPFSDLQVLRSFYDAMLGSSGIFLFTPVDSVVTGQPLAAPDTNSNTELVHTVGGWPNGSALASAKTVTNVTVLKNLLTVGLNNVTGLVAGSGLTFSNVGTATFLNTQQISIAYISGTNVYAQFVHSDYGSAADTGTATNNSQMTIQNESVQSMVSLSVFENGVLKSLGGDYTLLQPSTTSPYLGYVIHFLGGITLPVTVNYTYYYLCRFSDDSLDLENFMYNLWALKSLKIQQVRI